MDVPIILNAILQAGNDRFRTLVLIATIFWWSPIENMRNVFIAASKLS
jgi:hypothetical protein